MSSNPFFSPLSTTRRVFVSYHHGGDRCYYDWQGAVNYFMERAAVVVIIVGRSEELGER